MGPKSPQHIAASLAAANVVVVSQILTRERVSPLLFAGVTLFAITLPLNVFFYCLDDDFVLAQQQKKTSARLNILFARFLALAALNIAGFVLLFFYFGVLPGILFTLTSLFLLRRLISGSERGATLRSLRRVGRSLLRRVPPIAADEEHTHGA
jgi:hypothetical protein